METFALDHKNSNAVIKAMKKDNVAVTKLPRNRHQIDGLRITGCQL